MKIALLALFALSVTAAPQALTPRQAEGQRLYAATCIYCHNPRAYGTEALGRRLGPDKAVLDGREDLPDDYIRGVIKQGLGNMPAYTPTDLSDDEISAIVDYLNRSNPNR